MRRVRLAIQIASQREESDSEEESSLSDNENLVPPKKKTETRQRSAIGDRIGKLVLHFHGTKWAQSTAKVELLTYAFAQDNAAYTVALSASSFASLQ